MAQLSQLPQELLDHARTLPEGGPVRKMLFKAAGEIEGLREQLDALRDAFSVIDKAVRSPDTINALRRRNP